MNETEENEPTGSPKSMSRTLKVAVGAVSLAVAAVGVAGAVGTYKNAADLVGDGFALSMVAGGEGVVAVCAMVMLLLTVLGRPSPAALRVATVAMPVVASAVGAVVAPDVTTKVIMAVGPLAMTAAAEGLCLVARNAVAVATGVDVEADRRAMQRAASLDKHLAKDGRLSQVIVTRTRRQLVAVDPKAADLVAGALRRQVAADVAARMATLGAPEQATVVERAALDPAPEQAATPDATAHVAAVAPDEPKADTPEAPALAIVRDAAQDDAQDVTSCGNDVSAEQAQDDARTAALAAVNAPRITKRAERLAAIRRDGLDAQDVVRLYGVKLRTAQQDVKDAAQQDEQDAA